MTQTITPPTEAPAARTPEDLIRLAHRIGMAMHKVWIDPATVALPITAEELERLKGYGARIEGNVLADPGCQIATLCSVRLVLV